MRADVGQIDEGHDVRGGWGGVAGVCAQLMRFQWYRLFSSDNDLFPIPNSNPPLLSVDDDEVLVQHKSGGLVPFEGDAVGKLS